MVNQFSTLAKYYGRSVVILCYVSPDVVWCRFAGNWQNTFKVSLSELTEY